MYACAKVQVSGGNDDIEVQQQLTYPGDHFLRDISRRLHLFALYVQSVLHLADASDRDSCHRRRWRPGRDLLDVHASHRRFVAICCAGAELEKRLAASSHPRCDIGLLPRAGSDACILRPRAYRFHREPRKNCCTDMVGECSAMAAAGMDARCSDVHRGNFIAHRTNAPAPRRHGANCTIESFQVRMIVP